MHPQISEQEHGCCTPSPVLRLCKILRGPRFFGPSLGALIFTFGMIARLAAHEPVFSIGPETIFQGGFGLQTEFGFERGENNRLTALRYEVLYGVRENISITLSVPQILDRKVFGETGSGLGDISLRGKYRFFKRDSLGAQHKVTGILGVKIPTGKDRNIPPLGTGATDVLTGVTYGYESRTWYHFATLRYLIRTESDARKLGDRFLYDAAVGYRPWRREYLQWDLVGLLELSGEFDFENQIRGAGVANSGGNTLWLGPSTLLSYRNIMFKAGAQYTVYQDLRGSQPDAQFRILFGVEYHF